MTDKDNCDNITYRLATMTDIDTIVRLDRTVFKSNNISESYYLDEIKQNYCYVASQLDEIIGCILFNPVFFYDEAEFAYIKSLFSIRSHCKVGENLMKIAIENIQQNLLKLDYKTDEITIALHVNTNNYRALNLYFKLGFKIHKFIKKFYRKDGDGFLMVSQM